MDDDMQEGGDPAEAFDRLRAVVEGQDRELALLRRAVEGLAAERAAIDVPDYTETLGHLQQGVDRTTGRLDHIGKMLTAAPGHGDDARADGAAHRRSRQRRPARGSGRARQGGRGQGSRHGRVARRRRVRVDAGRPEEPAAMVRAGRGGDRHPCMVDPARPRRA